MWGISFPHFHALGQLMGNDRATGNHAEQFSDAIENMGSFMDNVDMHLGKLVANESDDMPCKVMDASTQMEGLSSGQVLEAAEIIMVEPDKLKVFIMPM
ncbi:hypothetical protein AgCh_016282 [Apium graveolens]